MEFGRREKMVAGGLAAVGLMAVLHFSLFGPRVAAWNKSAEARDAKKAAAAAIRVVKALDIDDLKSRTTASLDMLTSGVKALGMSQHEAFVLPTFADLKEPPAATPPTAADVQRLTALANAQIDKEIPLVLEEVAKLQKAARDAAAGGGTRLSFLHPPTPLPAVYGQPQTRGWALPVTLPAQMLRDPNALLDAIKTIAEYKHALNTMPPQSEAYLQSRFTYHGEMRNKLGIDYFYIEGNQTTTNRTPTLGQTWPGWPGVANFGEFVPLIDKLALANLILEQVKEYEKGGRLAVIPGVGRLNRNAIFDIVDIDVADIGKMIDGMKENKLYFLYEELLNLNIMVKMAVEQKLTDVTFVCLDGYSYLKKWTGQAGQAPNPPPEGTLSSLTTGTPMFPFQSDEMTIGESASANAGAAELAAGTDMDDPESMYEDEMMDDFKPRGGPSGGAPAIRAAPGDNKQAVSINAPIDKEEIGIAIPIKLVYQGTNDKIWKYIYDVLRAQPMTELQRMSYRTMSQLPNQSTNQNIEGTVTFVIVPKLFSVVDEVRKQLQSIKSAPATPAPAENNPM